MADQQFTCDRCASVTTGIPVLVDGRRFCCDGCATFGVCDCGSADRALARAALTAAIQPLAMAPTGPVPTLVLRTSGFRTDADMIAFAQTLERHPAVRALAVVRTEPGRAWFAVEIPSVPALEAALRHLDGFEVTTTRTEAAVDASVLPLRTQTTVDDPAPFGTGGDVVAFRGRRRIPFHTPQPSSDEPDLTARTVVRLPGYHTVMVYPFDSFSILNEFRDAVRTIAGVSSVRVRRFSHRTLYLDVVCADRDGLGEALRTMRAFQAERVIDHGADIELQLRVSE